MDNFLFTWKSVRNDAAQAVEDMPADKLDFTPQDGMMTFREIAEHIIYAARGLTGMVVDGEENLNTPEFREKLKKYFEPLPKDAGPEVIAGQMGEAIEADSASLAAKDGEFLGQMITRFDGMQVTRMEMLQFIKEHELTHRAHLFMYLRLNGVVPPTTRRRMAQKK